MRFTSEEAEEIGEALLDAVTLGRSTKTSVNITTTRSGKFIALVGDKDCGTWFEVDPPTEEPEALTPLKVAV